MFNLISGIVNVSFWVLSFIPSLIWFVIKTTRLKDINLTFVFFILVAVGSFFFIDSVSLTAGNIIIQSKY